MAEVTTQPEPAPVDVDGSTIRVRGLRVRYGDFEAVRGIDLDVRTGELFALLGTNGAGKTTTLEVLEGFRARTDGEVTVLGLDPAVHRSQLRRRMGIQLQDGGFVNELTVRETLQLWQQLVDRPDHPDRLLERFDLRDRANVPMGKLSGGEKRRVDLALAVWGSPELVILDEPTTGLDPESRRRTWEVIRELREGGCTIVLTTHYLEEAEALADRVAIMHAGRIAVAGTIPEIVSTQPARYSAVLPAGVEPPPFADLERTPVDGGTRVELRTETLQRDLTAFLNWAAENEVELAELRAAPASLADIYHAIREEER